MIMWLFKEMNEGLYFIFSTEDKADDFVKQYGLMMYDANGDFPQFGQDYQLLEIEVDPDESTFNKWVF